MGSILGMVNRRAPLLGMIAISIHIGLTANSTSAEPILELASPKMDACQAQHQKNEKLLALPLEELLAMGIEVLFPNLQNMTRLRKAFRSLGIQTIGHLVEKSFDDLNALTNFGNSTMAQVMEALASVNLRLRAGWSEKDNYRDLKAMSREELLQSPSLSILRNGLGIDDSTLEDYILNVKKRSVANRKEPRAKLAALGFSFPGDEAYLLHFQKIAALTVEERLALPIRELWLEASEVPPIEAFRIMTIGDLIHYTGPQILSVPRMRSSALRIIQAKLAAIDLTLADIRE